MKQLLATLYWISLIQPLFAQQSDLVLTTYSGQSSITALNSITLKPGFYIPSGSSVLIAIQSYPNVGSTPSTSQNYILERTFQISVKENQLGQIRNISQENQTVQYFDGLGRPIQIVELKASPGYKDIVQHMEYDGFGRETHRYLPYAEQTGNNGGFKPGAKASLTAYYGTSGSWDSHVKKTPNPYAITVFEASPLNRILQQGAAGAVWQPAGSRTATSGRTVVSEYGTNVATGVDAVKLWKINANGDGATSSSNFVTERLYRTVVKDENWTSGKTGTTEEFADIEGRVVMKRVWETESKKLETYYVYDDYGNVRYVIPPAVTVSSFIETAAAFTNYIYGYKYDGRHRVVEKKIPGKGWEHIVYNKNDQVVLTQDANQRAMSTKQWLYTKYDAFGRVVETGIFTSTATRASLQTALDNEANTALWETRTGADYTNVSYPRSSKSVRTVNYYDDYIFNGATTATLQPSGITRSQKVKTLLTGTRVYRVDGTASVLTINYYDDRSRLIQTAAQNQFSGGTDYLTNTYSFSGELLASKRDHKASAGGTVTTVVTTNKYDHVGRLVETRKKVNSQPEIMQSKLVYNEIGQLRQKDLHVSGSNATQEVVYAYNERGWLATINSPSSVTDKRRFGMQLNYANRARAYNGNIGSIVWNTKVHSSQTQTPVQTYTYDYDPLNRLKKAAYSATGKVNFFNEELAYDNMGNIDTLRRTKGGTGWANHFKYHYTGNRLSSVADVGSANMDNSYTYDANGNAISNSRLGITNIEYNYLNLPSKHTKGAQSLLYTYDATGKKLTKQLGTSATQYVDGIQYKDGAIEFIQTEEGRILPNGSSFIYEYFLKDHLGNVRAVVDHTGAVKQIQDYYPFGMEMNPGNAYSSSPINQYKYNGKEKQVELGLEQLDYGARFYDPVIGRFEAVDPVAEMFLSHSPFGYSFNNPVNFEDFDGMAPEQAINTDPIKLYGKQIDMTNAPGNKMNAAGHPRNGAWFWRQMLDKYPEMFSGRNSQSIEMGRAPVIDDQWVKHNPTHAEYKGGKLVHHHIDQGKTATGIPEAAHRKYFSNLHQNKGGRARGLGKMGNALGIFGFALDIFSSLSGDPHSLGMQFIAGRDLNTLYFDSDTEQYFEITSRSDVKDDKGNVIGKKAIYNTYSGYQYNKSSGKYEGVGKTGTYSAIRYEDDEDVRRVYHQLMNGI